jgi:myo-inositol 2-dehydrogenase / D-chiro-inositol 1-dehydrogenase
MTRLGLVGVGRIGMFHARTLLGLAEIDDLVITDADAARGREVAETLGARWAGDVDALLASGLDGLVVAASTGAHAELITRGVEAGLPVFCEKPVAATVDETIAVLRRVEELGGRVQIGFQRRFDTGYAAARAAVADGTVGRLHTLRGGTLDPAPPPAAYIKTSGGIFRDCGVHDFDIVRWVTGREIVEVFATGANRGEPFFTEYGDVDTAAATLRLDDGTLALVSMTRYNGAGYDVRLEAMGSEGTIAVGLDDHAPLRSAEPGVTWPAGPSHPGFMERFRDAYVSELRAFADLVAGRIESPCTVADALEASYVAEACELSRRDERLVKVAEVRQ